MEVDGTTIDDAEDFDLVMLMYYLLEYNSNYSDATRSFWFYSKDEATDLNLKKGIVNTNEFKPFKYKATLLENTEDDGANGILINANIAVALKYLSKF